MPKCLRYYIDDSGPRNPDRKPDNRSNFDWFGLGGVLIDEADKSKAEDLIAKFRESWPELNGAPFHSYEIRNSQGRFRWLAHDPTRRIAFWESLSGLMLSLPIVALACVIDRPGYNARYRPTYGDQRWQLCNTVFPIAVERAAKFARFREAKLRVYVERSDKTTEGQLRRYYEDMRANGLPFDTHNSAKYSPLTQAELSETLYEFGTKTKASDLMQIADLCLWPLCIGGYDPKNLPFRTLHDHGKTLDELCDDQNHLAGSKYSCFGSPQMQEPAPGSGLLSATDVG